MSSIVIESEGVASVLRYVRFLERFRKLGLGEAD